MVFNSIQFALFLPLVFAIYWLLRRNLRQQNLFVVLASYVFYGLWDWRFLILIAFTSFCSWGSGLLIGKELKNEGVNELKRKSWLTANIVLNLGILGVFKYYDFFVTEFITMFFPASVQPSLLHSFTLQIVLPVGISFYTFQALSYSIDVYRGRIVPTKDPIAFFAYVAFFPQLVAGPIERATNLLPQFEKARVFDYHAAVDGSRRILWGLFKKMVVADNCAIYVDHVWNQMADGTTPNGSTLVMAAILFAFQIYGDFSGYSDIAIGTAKLFGINLRDNFLTPYFSRNVAEFWKRWHISLNTWFVDYVYIPLGGSRPKVVEGGMLNVERKAQLITIRNTFVIFLLSGLWHGANWTYVTWGLYHALLFVPLILMGATKKYRDAATWKQIPQMLLTFGLVVIGWIIFRAPSIAQAGQFIAAICDNSLFSLPYIKSYVFIIPLVIGIIIMLIGDWFGREKGFGLAWISGKPALIRIAVYYAIVVMIYFWQCQETIQFIYFQF